MNTSICLKFLLIGKHGSGSFLIESMPSPLPPAIRGKILAFTEVGMTQKDIAKKVNVSKRTVERVQKRARDLGEEKAVMNDMKGNVGRKRKSTEDQRDLMLEMIDENPFMSANEMKTEAGEDLANLSVRLIQKELKLAGLHSRNSALKPNLKPRMVEARLKFCTDHMHWTPNDWMKVMFSDESSFNVVRCKARKVRRPVGERFNPKFITPTVKHPESVMVWGCFSGVGGRGGLFFLPKKVTMRQGNYRECLEEKMIPRFKAQGLTHFLQDSAPCHKAKSVMNFLRDEEIPLIDWPGNSPDLNPIENCWNWMKDQIKDFKCTSRQNLINEIIRIWCLLVTPEYCATLARSMPNHIQECLDNNGWHTHY